MDDALGMEAVFDRALESQVCALYAYFRRLGVAAAAADDLVQETCLVAWRTLSRVRRESDLRPWLYGIAHRCYLRHRRRAAREATAPLSEELPGALAGDPGSDERVTLQAVREALAQLPDRYLQPLALVYWEGLSYEEAARALSLPVGTLGWRVHQALALLKKALGQEGDEHEALSSEAH